MSDAGKTLTVVAASSLEAPHSTERPVVAPGTSSPPSPLANGGLRAPAALSQHELPDERPAAEHLALHGVSAEWERRASWLEAEAKAQQDAGARSRLLLAASEVRAMLGARADARRLAIQAASQTNCAPFATRQARALYQVHGDSSAVLKSLRDESRSAKTPTTRAHAHYLTAEVLRLLHHDEVGAEPCLEAAEQSDPSDYRATLQRLLRQLSQSQKPPEMHWRPDEAQRVLRHATGQLRQLRGAEAPRAGSHELAALLLVEIQRALRRGRLTDAADAISQLESVPGLRPAARWLSTLWRAATSTRPADTLYMLRLFVRERPGRVERRALAACALAAGDWKVMREALDERPHPDGATPRQADVDAASAVRAEAQRPVFSSVERLSLAALMGQPGDAKDAQHRRPAEELALVPLTSAIQRLTTANPDLAAATTPIEAEFALGRAAAHMNSFSELDPERSPTDTGIWLALLRLERSRETKDFGQLAHDLPKLMVHPIAAAECCFISAVFAEKAGDMATARGHYQAAMLSATAREAAVRAQSEQAADGAALFRALSAHTNDAGRRSLLLTEALFRLGVEAPEFDALADEAARTDPQLPFAFQLAEIAARVRGDRTRVGRWLARQRERARGSGDFALTSIQEALFVAQTDRRAGAECLRGIATHGSNDLALQQLREQLDDIPARAKAQFRRATARTLSARGREQFLAEAVALHESVGDRQAAISAARDMSDPLGALWVEQLSTEASDVEALSVHWQRLAQQTQNADLACDLYERLSRLELRRGDRDQALAWQTKRIELRPGSLAARRFLTVANMLPGRETELERLAGELGEQLADGDGLAYDFLATRLKIGRGAFQAARPNVGRASGIATPPLWALRLETVYCQAAGDDRTLLAVYRTLRERAHQPLDVATLSLRAAEAASRLAQPGLAKDEIQRAHEIAPGNVVILAARAEVLRNHEDYADAAEAFETLAAATHSKSQQVEALYQAASIWLDVLGDRRRGTSALKEAAAIDCPHPELLERLRQLQAQSSGFEGLGELIKRHSAEEAAEGAGASVEIAQTLALMQTGQWSEARQLIDALLARQPQNTEALSTSAEVHFRAREWVAAEQAWRRILDGGTRDRWRLAALRGLASLYEGELADSERTRAVHMDLLAEDPDDLTVRRRLIRTLTGLGRSEEAMEHQRELVARARGDEERRQYLLELVELCEKSPLGQREAEALLEQAHRTWPESPQVLKAEVAHYRLIGDHGTARVIVERATNAARNAIYAGRLEPSLFRTLEVAARLGGDPDTARAAQAALAAVRGQSIGLPGVGSQAGQQRFDDLIAPTPLSSGFRSLLYAAGAAIERAYAVDPRSYDPKPLPEPFASQVRSVAATFGLKEVRVVVSARTGCNCVCLYGQPMYVVFGQQLLDHSSPHVRDFLLLRALKLAQAHGCAISRMPPNELWGVVAGFLACFAPPWQANGLDAQRLVMARNKIRPHVTATPEPALTALTSAVTANIVPQAAQVGEALGRWAARVALFGVGDLGMALESLWAAAQLGPSIPKDVDGRIRWIASDGTARDLVGYSVSEAHTEARRRAGLTAAPR